MHLDLECSHSSNPLGLELPVIAIPFLDPDPELLFQFPDRRCQRCHDDTHPCHPTNSVPRGSRELEFGTVHIHYMPSLVEAWGVAVDAEGLEGREDICGADELAESVESEHTESDVFAEFELAESELVDVAELVIPVDISGVDDILAESAESGHAASDVLAEFASGGLASSASSASPAESCLSSPKPATAAE